MPIRILSPEVASQIAAGEVVERPASVVKELLENSLDAGATYITITVAGAGRQVIEVADNGFGIPGEELSLATNRHATSKLISAEDLFNIKTLGFRGEALASIGSVARMTITSRPADASTGKRIRIEAGIAGMLEPVGAPDGTVVRVESLFYNVPARLKFLKSDTTERRQIDTLVTQYALAYPGVRFHLLQDGRPALQTSGNGERREVLAIVYGVSIARQMLAVLAEGELLRVTGFISPISVTRSNRRSIQFFINGRPVKDIALTTAVVQAYRTLLMVGRFPLAVLFLDLPTDQVDVNVHPTKAEVRFREPNKIFAEVQRAVRRALLAHSPIPGIEEQHAWKQVVWQADQPVSSSTWEATSGVSGELSGRHPYSGSVVGATTPAQDAASQFSNLRTPILRLVGQIATAYLVAEGPDGLYLIDQHAAHERVLFEKLMEQRQPDGSGQADVPAQALLQPVTVELPPAEARLLSEQLPLLQGLGFRVEAFGTKTFLVRAVPELLSGMDPTAALRVVVEDFEEDEQPLKAENEARLIARVCKRAAIKAGQVLSPEEQKALITDLEACQSPRTCPHGRPTMIHLSVDLLERQFGRRGAR